MQFENVTKVSPTTYTFRLNNSNVTYANSLRRLIMTGVETVAFRADMTSAGTTTDVTIRENTTPMTNEMMAHRVGLLPINVKEPLKWNPDRYVFRLNVNGDKDKIRDVFAGDFEITEKVATEEEPVKVPTESFFPPHPVTRQTPLIATLYPGESSKIDILAKPTIGTGRENARFQPTSQCSYEYTRDSDPAKVEELFNKWLTTTKKISVEGLDRSSDKFKALEREFNTMEIARCYLKDEKGEPYSFDFTIESVGSLDVPYIVQRACEVGEAMVARYANIEKGELPDDILLSPSDSRIIGFDFMFRGHDHTLGNMLQTYLVDNHINTTDAGKTPITYAGYKVPHPLRDEMLLRIGVEDGQESTARKAVAEACRGCIVLFRQMRDAWMRATGVPVVATEPAAEKRVLTFRRKTPKASKPATDA